ncbi:MAG: hypothetical protein HRT72_01115 [Flavobacteriales bacterium]|nr:hypothetical protein [Flavobacteriales bacterium]
MKYFFPVVAILGLLIFFGCKKKKSEGPETITVFDTITIRDTVVQIDTILLQPIKAGVVVSGTQQAYTTEWAKFLTVNYDFHNVGEIHITFAAVDFSVTTMDGSIYEGAAYPVDSETGLFAYTSVSNTTYIDVENKEVESISISSYHVE